MLRKLLTALLTATLATASVLLVDPAPAHADSIRDKQWQLGMLRAKSAWKEATGQNVVVAVLDSGVDATHPDLDGQVLRGADFVDDKGDGRTDTVGHGTTVAALIAGRDDANGVVGIAHDARILPVRVLDRKNRYRDAKVVAKGLRWAVDHGAKVVNMSLGGSLPSPELADAIQYAYDNDVIVVACSGNLSGAKHEKMWYPAREPGVIAVTGLSRNRRFWNGSLGGPYSVLSAPADKLVGARPGGYWTVRGTSFAAPQVSAVAALIRSHWPDMTAANVINRLIRTARDLGRPGRDEQYGYGLVDPVGALTNPVASVEQNPLDTTPRSPDASASWSKSPAARSAHQSGGASPLWWAALGGLFGAVVVATLIAVVAVRRRRARHPAQLSPLVWTQER